MNNTSEFLGAVTYCIFCKGYAVWSCRELEHEVFEAIDWDPIDYGRIPPKLRVTIVQWQREQLEEEMVSPKTMPLPSPPFCSSRYSLAPRNFGRSRFSALWNSPLFFYDPTDWIRIGMMAGSIYPSSFDELKFPLYTANTETVSPMAQSLTREPPAFVQDDGLVDDLALRFDGQQNEDKEEAEADFPDGSETETETEPQITEESPFSYQDGPPMGWASGAAEHRLPPDNSSRGCTPVQKMTACEELRWVDKAIMDCIDEFDAEIQSLKQQVERLAETFQSDMSVLKTRKAALEDEISSSKASPPPVDPPKRPSHDYQLADDPDLAWYSDERDDYSSRVSKKRKRR
ncbi:hypothetical protein BJY01DRAFT_241891 [Aspergillus pseudoustus]|uniref:Uncharacterized protein n=1 Tax=Aspergillus pseudoustus TaxID=1810923 RepID=A0ABR4L216_9EURO